MRKWNTCIAVYVFFDDIRLYTSMHVETYPRYVRLDERRLRYTTFVGASRTKVQAGNRRLP